MLKSLCMKEINVLKTCSALQQQIRTTFILKRQVQPLLHKVNEKPKKLRGRHHIYELVEDTLRKKPNKMEVVLKTFVEGVGGKGDIVSVKPHFAYNKLLLPGLATYKTDENIAKYAKTETDHVEIEHSSPYSQRTIKMLNNLKLYVVMNKYQPWVLQPWHIKTSLRMVGLICNDECIALPKEVIEGPNVSNKNKEFICTVTVNNLEKANVKCRIYDWSDDPTERLPFDFNNWENSAEQLMNMEKATTDNGVDTKKEV